MEKINISDVKFELFDANKLKKSSEYPSFNQINGKCIINEDPLVYTVDNFISEEECNHFIKISSSHMKQALVSSNQKGESGIVSNGRTGSNHWIKHDNDNITLSVGNRIANYIGVPLNTAEQYQVIHYDVSQEYRQHCDSWDHDRSEKSIRCMKYGGQRLFTALVYLNDVEEGGGTCLTKLKTEVKPKKGRLLFFENVHKNTNRKQALSEHAGMPVIKGEKWAFNLWFREKPRTEIVYDPKPLVYEATIAHCPSSEKVIGVSSSTSISTSASASASTSTSTSDSTSTSTSTSDSTSNSSSSTPSTSDSTSNSSSSSINEFNFITNEINRTTKQKFITDDELASLDNVCETANFKQKNTNITTRKDCWVSIATFGDLINRISKTINVDESHFENINIVKYIANGKHCPHFDAYDFSRVGSEQRMKTHGLEGQRMLTITGSLSDMIEYKFPETSNYVELNRGDLLIYKNTIKNTTSRDIKMKKSIENRGNKEGIIFHIYVREKNKDGMLIGGIEGVQATKNIEINEEIITNAHPIIDENEEINDTLINAYSKIKEKQFYKSFNFCNKVNWESVLSAVDRLNAIRDPTYGILNKDVLDKVINFDEYTPAILNNVITNESLQIIQSFIREAIKKNEFSLGDRQSNRYKARNETVTRFLHYELVPVIRHITKKPVKPTYTYLACYTKDADLPAHTDQADCEYTVSFIIDKPDNANWPIYFDKTKQPIKNKGRYPFTPGKETCISCDCDAGGLMMFNGTDHIHYREACEYDYYNIVLLHYRV